MGTQEVDWGTNSTLLRQISPFGKITTLATIGTGPINGWCDLAWTQGALFISDGSGSVQRRDGNATTTF